ncbi:hypothetical protein HDU76_005714 [Blyttiomyces sp. JEL0837]|nr:hypothetical protein HDU76_005714 [Blyttiomyces sp. JEL0837]
MRKGTKKGHPKTIKTLLALVKATANTDQLLVDESLVLDCLDRCLSSPTIGPDNILTVQTNFKLGHIYINVHDYTKAEESISNALEGCNILFGSGSDNAYAVRIYGMFGRMYAFKGNFDKAEHHLLHALDMSSRLNGDDHPETLQLANTLEHERLLGRNHFETLKTVATLGSLYDRMGVYEQAEALKIEALEGFRNFYGLDDINTRISLNNLAALYNRMGKLDKAEPRTVEPGDKDISAASRTLGSLYMRQNRLVEARVVNLDAWNKVMLALLYTIEGEYDNAEPIFLDCIERMRGDYEMAVDHLSDKLIKMTSLLGEEHELTIASDKVLAYSVNQQRCPYVDYSI